MTSFHAPDSLATLEGDHVAKAEPLAPILSPRWALTWQHAAATAFLAASFILQAYMPLKPYGIFRDLTDAFAILESGGLPLRDPLLPYAESARYALLNAGGALAEAVVWRLAGAEGIAGLAILLSFGATLVWCRVAHRQCGDPLVAIPIAVVCFAANWGVLGYAGVSLFGRLLLPILVLVLQTTGLLASRSLPSTSLRRSWILVTPALFAVWANLDTSWILGLGLFATTVLGRLIDATVPRRSRAAEDLGALDLLTALTLSAAATLANPYGWKLWGLATLPSENNPFLATLGGIAPVPAWSLTGVFVALALCGAAIVLSRRDAAWAWGDILVLAVAVVGSFAHPLARVWTLPIMTALIVPPLFRMVVDSFTAGPQASGLFAGRHFAWTFVSGLAVWTTVALTPLGNPIFGSPGRSLEQIAPAAPFAEIPADVFARGLVFAPVEWAEAAAFRYAIESPASGSVGNGACLIADSRQAFLSPSMRGDLTLVLRVDPAWPTLLDRYEAKTLLLDPANHAALIGALRSDKRWREVGERSSYVRFDREDRVR